MAVYDGMTVFWDYLKVFLLARLAVGKMGSIYKLLFELGDEDLATTMM
jgi:hypothetical protein